MSALPFDQLVGLCMGPHEATEWQREHVFGMLLGHDHQGWWSVADHLSSDPLWSERDIGYHRDQCDPKHEIPYTWAGWLTQDVIAERFPPAFCEACDGPPHEGDEVCPSTSSPSDGAPT